MIDPAAELQRLVEAERAGTLPKFVFFWGDTPKAEGRPGPWFLSQWWPAPFEVEGVRYRHAEGFMMAAKARLFGDAEMLDAILAAEHPGEAKRLGGQVQGFDHDVWERERFEIVVRGNVAKFSRHDGLRAYLLGTGTRVLVEASPIDRIWGIGLAANDARAHRPSQWQGLNLLGFALMETRARLLAPTP